MPQPLSQVRPDALIIFDGSAAHQRPTLGLLAMKVIADWTKAEQILQDLFVSMLGSNPGPAAAVYASLYAPATQKAALRALAKIALRSDGERDALEAILDFFEVAIKPRNRLAHRMWGYSPQVPNGILLCKTEIFTQYSVASKEHTDAMISAPFPKPRAEEPELPRGEIFVWFEQDFVDASEQTREFINCVASLRYVVTRREWAPDRAERELDELLQKPRLQKSLTRIRRNRQSGPATPQ